MAFPAPGDPVRRLLFQSSATRTHHQNWKSGIEPVLPVEASEHTEETLNEWRSGALTDIIHQMMFVSGETAEPSIETTGMIEEIVHEQVVEMVSDERLICMRDTREMLIHRTTVEKVK